MPLTTGALDISVAELALASLFIVAAGAISLWGRIGLGKSILIGAVRCVLQLTIMGYVLSFIFWHPQYFIPLAGMVAGNSMTALGLSLDRLLSDLKTKRDLVEMRLCLGATPVEASQDIFRDALKAGMIPSINSLAGVGIVFLPGMMTGQILSGEDPMLAIRYQIVVMFMLVASTALTVSMVLGIVRQRCFSPGQQLLLRPNRPQ